MTSSAASGRRGPHPSSPHYTALPPEGYADGMRQTADQIRAGRWGGVQRSKATDPAAPARKTGGAQGDHDRGRASRRAS